MATIDTSEEVRGSAPASPPRENLVRATPGITLQRASGDVMPTLTGHFAVWDQWTEIRSAYEGNFMERFAPGSMTKTLTEGTPKVLFQHGKDPQIGEKPLGTVERLAPDETGAFYSVALFDTAYNRELLPGLEADAYGASFRFSVVRDDQVARPKKSEHNPRGLPERTIQEARVLEFGPVTFPAYAGATAGIRSMTDEYLLAALVEDPDRLRDMCRRAGISLAGVPVPVGTSANGAITINISGESAAVTRALTAAEPEPHEATTPDTRTEEPDPSGDTTPTEPEPSEATTHSSRGLFWFADYTPSTKE